MQACTRCDMRFIMWDHAKASVSVCALFGKWRPCYNILSIVRKGCDGIQRTRFSLMTQIESSLKRKCGWKSKLFLGNGVKSRGEGKDYEMVTARTNRYWCLMIPLLSQLHEKKAGVWSWFGEAAILKVAFYGWDERKNKTLIHSAHLHGIMQIVSHHHPKVRDKE